MKKLMLLMILCCSISSANAQATKEPPASAAGAGRTVEAIPPGLILNENAYWRSYYQFDWDSFSSEALKADGEKVLGKANYAALERSVKARLSYRKIDWTKTDWRDNAVSRCAIASFRPWCRPGRRRTRPWRRGTRLGRRQTWP